jgi:hypothetical protein
MAPGRVAHEAGAGHVCGLPTQTWDQQRLPGVSSDLMLEASAVGGWWALANKSTRWRTDDSRNMELASPMSCAQWLSLRVPTRNRGEHLASRREVHRLGHRIRRPASTPVRWLVLVAAALIVGLGTEAPTQSIPAFSWRRPLPAGAVLDARSQDLVASFNHQWRTVYGSVGINTDSYSIPIYAVAANQPTVRVTIRHGCTADPGLMSQLHAVPVPSDAQPARGGDHALVISQPSTDTEWELWQAQRDVGGNWSACWGGRLERASRSNGVFPRPYGLSASGLSYLASTIRVSELQARQINHALAVSIVSTTAGVQVPPANRNDGNSTSSDAIPEGTRFRLDPTVDVTRLGLPPAGVTIAKALQTYGMVVVDTSGAVVLSAEDGQPYVASGRGNPYASLFGSTPPYKILSKVPWNRLQALSPA